LARRPIFANWRSEPRAAVGADVEVHPAFDAAAELLEDDEALVAEERGRGFQVVERKGEQVVRLALIHLNVVEQGCVQPRPKLRVHRVTAPVNRGEPAAQRAIVVGVNHNGFAVVAPDPFQEARYVLKLFLDALFALRVAHEHLVRVFDV
jgi:hypothetical protein